MKNSSEAFTENDRKILENYKTLAEGLGEFLGEGHEIVIHSMETLENSVVKIVNGYHSGRSKGSPINDLGLSILNDIKKEPKPYFTYFNRTKTGEPLKSCTISIKGDSNKLIGLLCINFYMNTSISSVLKNFNFFGEKPNDTSVKETFAENLDELISSSLNEAKDLVYKNTKISFTNKNKEIINILYEKGIFNLKDSVLIIAEKLGISKNTVYMHLRNISNQ